MFKQMQQENKVNFESLNKKHEKNNEFYNEKFEELEKNLANDKNEIQKVKSKQKEFSNSQVEAIEDINHTLKIHTQQLEQIEQNILELNNRQNDMTENINSLFNGFFNSDERSKNVRKLSYGEQKNSSKTFMLMNLVNTYYFDVNESLINIYNIFL